MINNKKVVILLSSYNGGENIKEQIESILNQTYRNFTLIIRDDGSTDNTCRIIKNMAALDERITFIEDGKNLGYPGCFYYLTDNAPDADYYFFSDQDDYWLEDKIEHAIKVMEKYNSDIPLAYYARYRVCDSNLKPVNDSRISHKPITLKKALFEVCSLEFTMAINHTGLKLLNANKPSFCTGRGTWMCMLYAALGKIICDDYVCALYRRHENTVTSSSMSGWGLFVWRFKNFFKNGGFADYRDILTDFNKTVGHRLDKKNKRMLHALSRKKYFPYVIIKTFYPCRFRSKLIDEIALRISFLIGKL